MEESQPGLFSGHQVRLVDEAARVLVPGQPGKLDPQIHLIRDGKIVKAVEVICSCGQCIRLNCLYQ